MLRIWGIYIVIGEDLPQRLLSLFTLPSLRCDGSDATWPRSAQASTFPPIISEVHRSPK